MRPSDRYDEANEFSGADIPLPELPIPRAQVAPAPSEASADAPPAARPKPIQQPGFQAVRTTHEVASAAPTHRLEAVAPRRATDPDSSPAPAGLRATWEIAAQLTAGLLANPARSASSVKDAIALFDEVVNEIDSYSRVSSATGPTEDPRRRREGHEEYFCGAGRTEHQQQSPPPPQQPRPEPSKPRPLTEYTSPSAVTLHPPTPGKVPPPS